MRLIVRQADQALNEYHFAKGPIYIGRHTNSQILLPKTSVSRQHAVIYVTRDGHVMLEDLHSANGTLLNGKSIQKARIRSGDRLQIADFTIDIEVENRPDQVDRIHLDDTLIPEARSPQIIIRQLAADNAPEIILPAERAGDFSQATKAICMANGPQETVVCLVDLCFRQLHAQRAWAALREGFRGPMIWQTGKNQDDQPLKLSDLQLQAKIGQAVETGQFLLLPQTQVKVGSKEAHSAMIAPILEPKGCLGMIYLDNGIDQEHYSLRDLDYLMLLAIHTAAVLEGF